MEKFYSIPEVADIIGVHTSTVFRWVKAGKLNSFRFANGTHNKIAYKDVVELLKSHDLPLDRIEIVDNKRVLLIDDDEALLDLIPDIIKKILGYEVKAVKNKMRAGFLVKAFKPNVILVDNVNDDLTEDEFIDMVKDDKDLQNTKIVKFTGSNMTLAQAKERGFDGLMKKPMNNDEIAGYIKSLFR